MSLPDPKKDKRIIPGRRMISAAGLILLILLPADTAMGASPLAPVCPAEPAPAGAAGAQWFPREREFFLEAARELLARPDFAAALCYLQTIETQIADDPQALADLGEAFRGNGRVVEAIGAWERARAAGNDSDLVLRGLRDGYLQTGQWDAAEAILAEWHNRHPEDSDSAFRLALIRAADDPQSALDLLDSLAEEAGPVAERAFRLANVIRAAAALQDLAYLYARTGQELIQLDEPALARSALRNALSENPGYGDAYALLGLAQESEGTDPGDSYRKAAQYSPDSVVVCLLYGSWLERTGQLDDARTWLTRAWEREPGNWTIAAELARTDLAAGNPSAAEDWLLQAVQMYPEDSGSWQALAAFYIENDLRIETDGLPAARQAVLLDPEDARAVGLLGLAWFRMGDFPEAERLFRRAIELDPSAAEAHLHLGWCLLEQGRTGEAGTELRLAEELDPNGETGAQARTLLEGG
jgi:tetratricopeptide (TPR) repeat protein